MNLHIKSPGEAAGVYPLVSRGTQLKHLSFTVVELGGTLQQHSFETGEEEVALDFFTGPVQVQVEGPSGRNLFLIPARAELGTAHPMVFVPAQSTVRLESRNGGARITVSGALGKPGAMPVLIEGRQIVTDSVGKANWNRQVHTHIADNIDAAHLICGETFSQSGGWTSCPPHKHDRFNAPSEVPMEEIYYFQVTPKQGFGFMRVYSGADDLEPFDEAYAVQHGDTVLIPRGYHPVSACPGYRLNYEWILAGEGRLYGAWSDDPNHTWIKNV